ncbi:hypothetical protein NYQ10_21170 [Flavobacterium johnsoniae]|uniref:hypothetical protein n=1 Tax=Flavobacterium johnsoniae TaxID=986 RepID=UPI0025AF3679|nr:hypothetical protein [Flavobacterium johnsoniae]WJS94596.1 hypothetical protein NYQ10_21170 [Flavobacterium johnsoniae]
MSKFHLNIKELVQGEFKINKVNIAFVFQVNCPGCFIYGIPITNELYRLFSDKVGFIGIATAFEDFEYNNEESLKLLLENGTLVGETKKYYTTNYGISNYGETLNFPVAFDSIISSEEFINSNKVELICNAIPNFENFPEKEKEIVVQKVKEFYSEIALLAETFTLNQLKGTPSFVIFDDNYNVLGNYFGHQNLEILKTKIEDLLS